MGALLFLILIHNTIWTLAHACAYGRECLAAVWTGEGGIGTEDDVGIRDRIYFSNCLICCFWAEKKLRSVSTVLIRS